MSPTDTTAAMLAGMFGGNTLSPSNKGYFDLSNFTETLGANDIYKQLASPVMAAKFDTSTWSPGQTLGVTAGQAFLGAALKAIGQRNEGEQLAKVASVLPQLYSNPSSVAVPEGVDPEAFGGLKLSAMKENAMRTTAKDEARYKLFGDVLTKQPSMAMKMFPDIARELKLTADVEEARPAIPAPTGPINPLSNGKDSSSEKLKKYFDDFSQTMPPVQAAAAARQQVEGEIRANNKTFDEAKAAREYGNKLLEIANTAKAGMSQAGQTGNFQGLRHGLDYIMSPFSEEANNRITGDAVLDSIRPKIVQMERSPGAVSDYETKLYLGAGPSTFNTPDANAVLAKKMEDIGKLNVDYADFLEAYREANSGSTVGAATKWQQYKDAYPIFNTNGNEILLNSNRPSWQDFFNSGGADSGVGGASGNWGGAPMSKAQFAQQAKARGLTKEQARAEWAAMGGN